jgi:hypothetical protein
MVDQKAYSIKNLYLFLAGWAVLNIIQGTFTDLHPDEAYYWLYSKFLDWGYFDHPPMVALFIKTGDLLSHSSLGLRIVTVITTTLSFFLLWETVKGYANNIKLFILLASSIVLFHVYGFITTPDSPLFFFTVLFFYLYQRYLKHDSYWIAALLALVIACLLYSKYHAILVLFFTILSNFKLFRRPSFWFIIVFSIIAFLPHIWWQVQNGYPSFFYHIIDRSAEAYRFEFTYQYLLGQLALAGPLVGWYLYKNAATLKANDSFLRALKFNCYGIFIFFFLSTLKGRVEAHWTLPGMICLFMLAYVQLSSSSIPNWFRKLTVVNISLIFLTRLILIFPIPLLQKNPFIASYFGTETWAKEIKKVAGTSPVIFVDSFQWPSKYNFYTNSTKGFAYDSRTYRKNQYDIWPLEDSLRNKKVYYLLQHIDQSLQQDTILTNKGKFYGTWIDNTRIYQKVNIEPIGIEKSWKADQTIALKLKIHNPYAESIYLGNTNEKWKCYLEYGYKFEGKLIGMMQPVDANLGNLRINRHQSSIISAVIQSPQQAGKYKLIFSIRTEPFYGSRNSSHISVEVKP